ncbi:MAG: zinc ribbon domain-containing protein [Ignavibacteriae bacterium]|nr:zinc ribbon domain-containing protein [Ignavibacteriota bacterium]
MPTYDYKCESCNHEFEIMQSIKDDPLTKCPECGKNKLKKVISGGAGLIFKGSGFYLTDYKNKQSNQKKSTGKVIDTTGDTSKPAEKKASVSKSSKK